VGHAAHLMNSLMLMLLCGENNVSNLHRGASVSRICFTIPNFYYIAAAPSVQIPATHFSKKSSAR